MKWITLIVSVDNDSPHQPRIDINCCTLYHHSRIKSVTDCIIIILLVLRLIRNIIDLKGDTTYTNTIYIISITAVIKYPSLMFTILHYCTRIVGDEQNRSEWNPLELNFCGLMN